MQSIIKYFFHPSRFFLGIVKKLHPILKDRLFLQLRYFFEMGEVLHLDSPVKFTEKIQWLKLYNRKVEYTKMVDKYAVKEYVAKTIGIDYIIPTLGVWDMPYQIEWDTLPNQFVLKTTNGGGSNGVVIVKDKSAINKKEVENKLLVSLKNDIYRNYVEWPYKEIKPRIIAEKYMEDPNSKDQLTDYKFFCFNGEPRFCQVIRDRKTRETIDFYDMNWVHQEFVGLNPSVSNGLTPVTRPSNLSEMQSLCKKLAFGIPFVRIDFYLIEAKTYFGEITFYPASGFGRFKPEQYNTILGDMILLPN